MACGNLKCQFRLLCEGPNTDKEIKKSQCGWYQRYDRLMEPVVEKVTMREDLPFLPDRYVSDGDGYE